MHSAESCPGKMRSGCAPCSRFIGKSRRRPPSCRDVSREMETRCVHLCPRRTGNYSRWNLAIGLHAVVKLRAALSLTLSPSLCLRRAVKAEGGSKFLRNLTDRSVHWLSLFPNFPRLLPPRFLALYRCESVREVRSFSATAYLEHEIPKDLATLYWTCSLRFFY